MGRRTHGSTPAGPNMAPTSTRTRQALLALALTGAGAGAIFGAQLINNASAAGGTLRGLVFNDHNANGTRDLSGTLPNLSGNGSIATAVDLGVAGIGVKIYSADGALIRSTATTATGEFQVSGLASSGVVRVEFSNLPSGFRAGPVGPDSHTAVQFVDLADSDPTADFSVQRPDQYCQDNPLVAASCSWLGTAEGGANSAESAIIGVPWAAGSAAAADDPGHSTPATPALRVRNDKIGPTWGLAYDRVGQRLFAAAHFRRHAGFGPGGPSAIYAIDPTTGDVTDMYYVDGSMTNAHGADLLTDGGDEGFAAVGTTSLGGLAMAEDGSRMYVMNLSARKLVAMDPATGAELATRQVPLSPPGCAATNDVRPFAVTVEGSSVYVGLTCTAQSTGNSAQLRAYVYRADPGTLAFSAAPVFQADLDYPRTNAVGTTTATWQPWTATYPTLGALTPQVAAQPFLTQIVFDRGNLVLGIRDRFADQTGVALPSNPREAGVVSGTGAGDLLRACATGAGAWTLEANGRCGGDGSGPQGTSAGPGGAEFYADDHATIGDEVTSGALAMVPGTDDIVTGARVASPGGALPSNALRWFGASAGTYDKAYRVGDALAQVAAAPGIGGIAILCDGAPIEIGNRVWRDNVGNGVQDAGEPGIGGVTVQLWTTGSGAELVGTATTSADGSFRFRSATSEAVTGNGDEVGGGLRPSAGFQIRIPFAGPNASVLAGTYLTVKNATAGGGTDLTDSDATAQGTFGAINVSTGIAGRNTHDLDAGFARPVSVGDLVWNDGNNDGLPGAGENGIPGVTVRLLDANSAQVSVTSTNASGHYSFSGLAPADYQIEVVPPLGYATSTGKNGWAKASFEPAPGPNDDRDGDDNGSDVGGAVRTAVVRLTSGSEPTNDGDDADSNRTVDVGLFRAASIGDLVWFDNDGNGTQAGSEPGVPRVSATIYDAHGAEVATAATSGSGRYVVNNLIPGQYSVGFTNLPTGYLFSTRGSQASGSDSDADPATGRTTLRVLAAGQTDASIDAGIYIPGDGFNPATPQPTPKVGVSGNAPKGTEPAKITIHRIGPAKARPGQKVKYEITVRVSNTSSSPAFGVSLSELLPKGLRVSPSPGNPTPSVIGSTLTWMLGDLAPGGTRTIRYVVRLDKAAKGSLVSRAVARARNAAKVSASVTTRVVRSAKAPFSIETS